MKKEKIQQLIDTILARSKSDKFWHPASILPSHDLRRKVLRHLGCQKSWERMRRTPGHTKRSSTYITCESLEEPLTELMSASSLLLWISVLVDSVHSLASSSSFMPVALDFDCVEGITKIVINTTLSSIEPAPTTVKILGISPKSTICAM